MSKARYFVRLDDACPQFQIEKWQPFFDLFDKYDIKPIIAVIPDNKDPKIQKGSTSRGDFWKMVRQWQAKGWCVALHGLNHLYVNDDPGILGITRHSEFAGRPEEEQRQMLVCGLEIFRREGVEPSTFVAPSHSLDANTIKVLKELGFDWLSDGLFTHPTSWRGINWLPCQLWGPKEKKDGTWTMCFHPETTPEASFKALERFIEANHSQFSTYKSLYFTPPL